MAHFDLTQKWLTMLRAIRAVTAREPTQQQLGSENKTCEEERERDPNHCTSAHMEDKPSENAETETPAEDTGEDTQTAHMPSRNNDSLAKAARGIELVWRHVADKSAALVKQARDFALDAVEKVKQLGLMGTAKAVGDWAKKHPWKTALIVVPLVATACTAIVLLFTGFGPAGIVAGSTAAAIQAGIGNVVAGSIFATCTSAMMGGYGAGIVFGGVWFGSTALIIGLKACWDRWKSQSQRAMVLSSSIPSKTATEEARQAVSDAMFWTMFAAAYVVYRFKSWHQGRAEVDLSIGKLKRE